MTSLFIFITAFAVGVTFTLVITVAILSWRLYPSKMLILIGVGIISYYLYPWLHFKPSLLFIPDLLSNAIPLSFLLFIQAVFSEHKKPDKLSLLIGLIYLSLSYLVLWLNSDNSWRETLWIAGRSLMIVVAIYSLFTVLHRWKVDLVERRRKFRMLVLIVACSNTFAIPSIELMQIGVGTTIQIQTMINSYMLLSTLLFAVVLIALGPSELFSNAKITKQDLNQLSEADQYELNKILLAMNEQHLYREVGQSIKGLSEQLSIPEHRLRRYINEHLGYRNFNDFLNSYRLREIKDKLCSMELARVPILTLSMDAGYQSIATFNKVFKISEGLTPKAYRQKALSIS